MITECDVLILGGGIAGLSAALELSKRGVEVVLVQGQTSGNSAHAQGGIATVAPEDSEEIFFEDILNAGCGLCYEPAVRQLVEQGPQAIQDLLSDVPFEDAYAKEGAHSVPRILFKADHTGRAIIDVLRAKVSVDPRITVLSGQSAVDLITLSHHSKNPTDQYAPPTCVGAYILSHETGLVSTFFAKETILATGGVGECFLHTTNCQEARGDGIAMAYRAGVRIMNMEYVQFHPTALYSPREPRFLLTEALRGEGGRILSLEGQELVAPLAPRDVAARAIFQEMIATSHPHVWLDMRHKTGDEIASRFPTIYAHCRKRGLVMEKDLLPIVPAAHFSCGGVAVDLVGQTSMRGLRAIGEVACSGVHGANRLASTALLEGVVWGQACARSIELKESAFPEVESWQMGSERVDEALVQQDWLSIKQTMWNYVGLLRSTHRLKRALRMLRELKWEVDSFYADAQLTSELIGLRNGVETALLITHGAFQSPKARGCNYRVDEKSKIGYN